MTIHSNSSLVSYNSQNSQSFFYSPYSSKENNDELYNTSITHDDESQTKTAFPFTPSPDSQQDGSVSTRVLRSLNQNKGTQSSQSSERLDPRGKVRRSLLDKDCSKNLGPSVQFQDDPFRLFTSEVLEEEVKQHAFMRIQAFALTVTALFGVANGSDPNDNRDIGIKIGRAYMQIGKGTRQQNAAHFNAAAGYTDDWREVAIKRIAYKNGITPNTQKLLACKGFTEAEFVRLKNNCYRLEEVVKSFDKMWPVNQTRPHSLLSGTSLELFLNSTSKLPASVNLFVDKSLEDALRPEIEELYRQIMHAEITREEACERYCILIWRHFNNLEPEVERRIGCMEKYIGRLNQLLGDAALQDDKIQGLVASLDATHVEMRANNHEAFKYSRMHKNEQFLSDSMRGFGELDGDPIASIKVWISQKGDEILGEAKSYLGRLQNYRKFSVLEREGTKIPDFSVLFGKNEVESLEHLQATLLSPVKH